MCDFLQQQQISSTSPSDHTVTGPTVNNSSPSNIGHLRGPSLSGIDNNSTGGSDLKKARLDTPSVQEKQLQSSVNCGSSTSSTSSSANSFYESNATQQNLPDKVKEGMPKLSATRGDEEYDDDEKRNLLDAKDIEEGHSSYEEEDQSFDEDDKKNHCRNDGNFDASSPGIKNANFPFDNPFMQSILNSIKANSQTHTKGSQNSMMNSIPNFLNNTNNNGSNSGNQRNGNDTANPLAAFMAMSPFFQQNSSNEKQMSELSHNINDKLSPMLAAAAGFAFSKMSSKNSSQKNSLEASNFMGSFMKNNNFLSQMAAHNNGNNFNIMSDESPPLSPMMIDQNLEHLPANTASSNNGQQWTFEEQFKQLYELSDDPKRRQFLDDLFLFMQKRGTPVNRIPIMAKQVLDLHALYQLVVSRGGLVEVINKKLWREITKGLNLPSSITSAAFTLRTQYMKYLYPYECEKLRLSNPSELQSAIDGNRREARRASYNFEYPPLMLSNSSGGQQSPNNINPESSNTNNQQTSGSTAASKGLVDFNNPEFGSNSSGGASGNFQNPFFNSANSEAMANFLSVSNLFPNGSPFNKSSTPMKNRNNSSDEKQSRISPSHHIDGRRSKSPEEVEDHVLYKKQKSSNDDTGHGSSNSSDDLNKSSQNAYQQILSAAMSGNPNALNNQFLSNIFSFANRQTKKFESDSENVPQPSNGPLITLKTPSGTKNISDSPLKICIQPGAMIGLPENAVMVMMELNRSSFQGVLFSNPINQNEKKSPN